MEDNNISEIIYRDIDDGWEKYISGIYSELTEEEQYAHILKYYEKIRSKTNIIGEDEDIEYVTFHSLIIDNEVERILNKCIEDNKYEEIKSIFMKI